MEGLGINKVVDLYRKSGEPYFIGSAAWLSCVIYSGQNAEIPGANVFIAGFEYTYSPTNNCVMVNADNRAMLGHWLGEFGARQKKDELFSSVPESARYICVFLHIRLRLPMSPSYIRVPFVIRSQYQAVRLTDFEVFEAEKGNKNNKVKVNDDGRSVVIIAPSINSGINIFTMLKSYGYIYKILEELRMANPHEVLMNLPDLFRVSGPIPVTKRIIPSKFSALEGYRFAGVKIETEDIKVDLDIPADPRQLPKLSFRGEYLYIILRDENIDYMEWVKSKK